METAVVMYLMASDRIMNALNLRLTRGGLSTEELEAAESLCLAMAASAQALRRFAGAKASIAERGGN